jgi:hypothetical protein
MKRSHTFNEAYMSLELDKIYLLSKIACKKTDEPLEGLEARVHTDFHEMTINLFVVLLNESFENLLID